MLKAAILHDPNLIVYNKFLHYSQEDIFKDNFLIILSPDTPREPYNLVLDNVYRQELPDIGMASARRMALNLFNSTMAGQEQRLLFLVDFDRLLYWIEYQRAELYNVLDSFEKSSWVFSPPFTIIGRTEKAMMTHPITQRKTERTINAYFYAKTFGEGLHVQDFTAGTYVVNHMDAPTLLNFSHATDPGAVDVEWAAIGHLIMGTVDFLQVDGLGYEGEWLGLESPTNKYVQQKRYNNLSRANAMTDIISIWRQR